MKDTESSLTLWFSIGDQLERWTSEIILILAPISHDAALQMTYSGRLYTERPIGLMCIVIPLGCSLDQIVMCRWRYVGMLAR